MILIKGMNLIKKESKFIVDVFIEVSLNRKNFSKFIVENILLFIFDFNVLLIFNYKLV